MTVSQRVARARASGDLFARCRDFTAAREVAARGIYPYFHPIEQASDTEVVIRGERKIQLGSNNYLGLTHHPLVRERARAALDRFGTGCTGSRLLNGTLALHEELEARLAEHLGTAAALVFPTGYQTNLGVLSALLGRDDVVIVDRLCHASLVDGARLAPGTVVRHPHGDMAALRRALDEHREARGILVVTDGVFSMEGDIADLPALVAAADGTGARLLVDDAHGFGVLGAHGGGTVEHHGLGGAIDLITVTFSKSCASIGGAVAGPEPVIHYLKHHARPFIFSASLPPAAAATVLACLEVMRAEPERRRRLWANAAYLRDGLRGLGFDTGRSQTPIISLATGDMSATFTAWRTLFDAGVFVNAVSPPAIPGGGSRLRLSVTAGHRRDQLDAALAAFAGFRAAAR